MALAYRVLLTTRRERILGIGLIHPTADIRRLFRGPDDWAPEELDEGITAGD